MSGKRRRNEGSDILIIQEITDVCEMEGDSVCVYKNGSIQENGLAVEGRVYVEEREKRWCIRIDKKMSVFLTEIFSISSALKLAKIEEESRDVIILSDFLSAIQAVKNNRINVYKNRYVLEARVNTFFQLHQLSQYKKKVVLA